MNSLDFLRTNPMQQDLVADSRDRIALEELTPIPVPRDTGFEVNAAAIMPAAVPQTIRSTPWRSRYGGTWWDLVVTVESTGGYTTTTTGKFSKTTYVTGSLYIGVSALMLGDDKEKPSGGLIFDVPDSTPLTVYPFNTLTAIGYVNGTPTASCVITPAQMVKQVRIDTPVPPSGIVTFTLAVA